MSTATPPRHAPRALWLIAQAFLSVLYNLFGAPEDVARQHTLTRKAHELLAQWLRAGEAMMRRLLLIEAAAVAKANARKPRTKLQRQRKLMHFTPDDPEAWRVSFRCAAPTYRRLPAGSGANGSNPSATCRLKAGATSRFRSAWPLAERYEALLRAYNNPTPYARRLAARLYAQPQLTSTLLQAPPGAAHLVGAHDFDALGEHAEREKSHFNNSS